MPSVCQALLCPENGQDQAILIRSHEETPITTTGRATIETSTLTTTFAVLATSTTATAADVGMESSSPFLPNGSPSRPTATATCRS